MLHLVLLSGGMDSYTLLHYVNRNKGKGDLISALSFNYKQRHSRELRCAMAACNDLNILHKIITLDFLPDLAAHSALTADYVNVPHGHYADASMKKTVVPGRNTIFLACALAMAESANVDQARIYYAAHAGDHPIYPDCRPAYITAMAHAVAEASEYRVSLDAPFAGLTKGDILRIGIELGLTYDFTHTCYEGTSPPCGKCGACVERAEAFAQNGIADPILSGSPQRAFTQG